MVTNITKLKKSKGNPPPADGTADVTVDPGRGEDTVLRPLQVRIPERVFEEFSAQAGREFGYRHGAKKQLFLKMWAAYRAQNMCE
ncbi:MAG: hypothetical protein RLQ73_02575 [Hoeflea sp. D1-CHI-28]